MRALVFDCETTGLIQNGLIPLERQPRIVEFSGWMIDADTGEVSKKVEQRFNPGVKLSDEVKRITGLMDDDLKMQPRWGSHALAAKRFIEDAEIVVAHNLNYDKQMIDLEQRRAGLEKKADLSVRWPALCCTVENTEHLIGRRMSLTELHAHLFGEEFEGAHSAGGDVAALARCYVELRRRGVL